MDQPVDLSIKLQSSTKKGQSQKVFQLVDDINGSFKEKLAEAKAKQDPIEEKEAAQQEVLEDSSESVDAEHDVAEELQASQAKDEAQENSAEEAEEELPNSKKDGQEEEASEEQKGNKEEQRPSSKEERRTPANKQENTEQEEVLEHDEVVEEEASEDNKPSSEKQTSKEEAAARLNTQNRKGKGATKESQEAKASTRVEKTSSKEESKSNERSSKVKESSPKESKELESNKAQIKKSLPEGKEEVAKKASSLPEKKLSTQGQVSPQEKVSLHDKQIRQVVQKAIEDNTEGKTASKELNSSKEENSLKEELISKLNGAEEGEADEALRPQTADKQSKKVSSKEEALLKEAGNTKTQIKEKPLSPQRSVENQKIAEGLQLLSRQMQVQKPKIEKLSPKLMQSIGALQKGEGIKQILPGSYANTSPISGQKQTFQAQGLQKGHFQNAQLEQLKEKVMQQVRFQLKLAMRNGLGEVKMRLDPQFLGGMRVKLVLGPQDISATFLVETQSVKEILQKSLGSLEQTLSERGIDVERIEVKVDNNDLSQDFREKAMEREQQKVARQWIQSFRNFGEDLPELHVQDDSSSESDSQTELNIVA